MKTNFYKVSGPYTFRYIASKLDAELLSKKDFSDHKVKSFNGLDNCTANDITFLNDNINIKDTELLAKGYLVSKNNVSEIINDKVLVKVNDLHSSVAKLSNIFYSDFTENEKKKIKKTKIFKPLNYISKKSLIKNGCILGKNASIGDGSILYEGCIIGNNVNIGSNTIIRNTIIGDNVTIGSNASIGQSGFGFAFNKGQNIKIFHTGRVIIQDNSYIGCNCTIDRGSFSDTVIGENVYLDNQIHVAHNVQIGSNTMIAAQTGIAGSVKIGSFCKIGGQVGIANHISIGNNVEIAAKSAVRSNIDSNKKIMGDPAINMFTYLKNYKKYFR